MFDVHFTGVLTLFTFTNV